MENISKVSDIALAGVVIGILAMIILPIGPDIIDYLIAINLTVSVSLLMVALYIPSAVQLSIFPSLLLITTLYRLGPQHRLDAADSASRQRRAHHLSIR